MNVLKNPNREGKLVGKKWKRNHWRKGKGWRWLEPYCWYCIPGGLKRQILKLRKAKEQVKEELNEPM